MKLKMQHLIASVIAFIVVLLVSTYVLQLIIAGLLPSVSIPVTKGIATLLGFFLAIVAAYYAGKLSAKYQAAGK